VLVYGPQRGLDAPDTIELARKLNVVRAGYVDGPDLGALFRHAHAFMMPSLYEGFGLPVVEAMASGCPVITSNRGSLPEIAGAGAQCFDPLDIHAMAAALVALLLNPDELQKRKADALTRAADFSWDKAARETIWVYHHVNQEISAL
jgi:glycosyltransferase involved in cell wall biosynthesis